MFRRAKLSLTKHLKVTFVGEPAVDAGGPLREFFHYILLEIAENDSLLSGSDTTRCSLHNLVELERKTYYVGVIIALSLIHGGPAPHFFFQLV